MSKVLQINVSGCDTVPWAVVREWEFNDLKDDGTRELDKLQGVFERVGFIVPLMVWKKGKARPYVLDGHSRKQTLQRMEDDDWEIPDLPVNWIDQATKQLAMEAALYVSSEYSKVTGSSLGAHLGKLKLSGQEMLKIRPMISLPKFEPSSFDFKGRELAGGGDDQKKTQRNDARGAAPDPKDYGGATSIARGSAPMRIWKDMDLLTGDVLDFGCGKEEHEFTKYDIVSHPDPSPLRASWDVVVCNYVLNVQPADHLVTQIVCLLSKLIKPKGQVLIAVRTDVKSTGRTAAGFQQSKSVEEWAGLIGQFLNVVETKTGSGWVGFICRRLPKGRGRGR